ncbi:MAG: ankyrin repeat domain-containing protein [Acidobacteria bacterium]|nr:ankyrin repeat domain-containing protein [Acidobacteriota bacterium]
MRGRRSLILLARALTVVVILAVTTYAAGPTAPIADAAMRGDSAAVQALINGGADVNAAQGDGMTALHWTALNGDAATTALLLSSGATVEPLTRLGRYTPLHLASSRGHAAAVQRLLDAGSAVGAFTDTGVQPLHLAAQAGDPDAVTSLLAHGADINAQDKTHGRTPLVFAVAQNRLEAMRLLIAKGADIARPTSVIDYEARSSADSTASAARRREIAETTGRPELPDPDTFNAQTNGDPPDNAIAVTAGRAGRGRGQTTGAAGRGGGRGGAAAARGGGRGGGASGPSSNQQIGKQGGMTALHYAARDGFAAAADLLLESGMDVNATTSGDLSSPLLVATVNGQYDIAMMLLERGADVNLMNDDAMGPLFAVLNNEWALRTWYPQPTAGLQQRTSYLTLVEKLGEAGADPNARVRSHIWHAAYNAGRMGVDFAGATPFWRAAYALDVEAMRLLVRLGADPSISTMTFGTAARPNDPSGLAAVPTGGPYVPPFHAASGVGYGSSRVAQQHQYVPDGWMPAAKYFLEELKVDVNMRDANGFTALHHAAARGDNDMVRYLVKMGADVMAVNRSGQTTVDMANSPEQRTQPFPETIALLEGMGAKNNHRCQACK